MARLLNVMGASRVLPDRDIATPMSWAYVFGAGPYGNRSSDAINAKHHVIWGGDTAVSQKQLAHFFLEARDAGTELVVIDIAYRVMPSKADWFIPVHPGYRRRPGARRYPRDLRAGAGKRPTSCAVTPRLPC